MRELLDNALPTDTAADITLTISVTSHTLRSPMLPRSHVTLGTAVVPTPHAHETSSAGRDRRRWSSHCCRAATSHRPSTSTVLLRLWTRPRRHGSILG
jgi:hypothetical protein